MRLSVYRPGTGIVQRIILGVPLLSPIPCALLYGSIIPERNKITRQRERERESRVKINSPFLKCF
jgi:hypothetical protein